MSDDKAKPLGHEYVGQMGSSFADPMSRYRDPNGYCIVRVKHGDTSRECGRTKAEHQASRYSSYATLEAYGRPPLPVTTCLTCGAAVLLDEDKGADLHDAWHRTQEASK